MFVLKDDVQDRLASDHENGNEWESVSGRGRGRGFDHSFLRYCYRRLGEVVGRARVGAYAYPLDWSGYWGGRGYGPFVGI